MTVWTIGHGTRSSEELIAILRSFAITMLGDVRTVPRSRHNPQFNRDVLPGTLESAGIRYTHLPTLGGLRRTTADSINTAWRNLSFRGYADYMQTDGFAAGLASLLGIAEREKTAIMCAEAVPWRCHRSLIADALVARGHRVEDILGPHTARAHELTPWARVTDGRVTYPAPEEAPRPDGTLPLF